MEVIQDKTFADSGTLLGMLEVRYPEESSWHKADWSRYVDGELERIREEGRGYSRDEVFRHDTYFRYFRKFKKTNPLVAEVESFLLKGRPFPTGHPVNEVTFLTELDTHMLLGTHDLEYVQGPMTIYLPTEKEPFTGLHGRSCHCYPGDVTVRDDGGIIMSMIAGADDRTSLKQDSRHVAYMFFCTPDVEAEQVEAARDKIRRSISVLAPDAETEWNLFGTKY